MHIGLEGSSPTPAKSPLAASIPADQRPPNRPVVSDLKRAMARLASATTLNLTSRGSLGRSRPRVGPPVITDEEMAWLLVDAVNSSLTGYDRTTVFVELGGGECYLVIAHILVALMSSQVTLPVAILAKLTLWLNGYAGCSEEPRLRVMLDVLRLQQCEVVSPVRGSAYGN